MRGGQLVLLGQGIIAVVLHNVRLEDLWRSLFHDVCVPFSPHQQLQFQALPSGFRVESECSCRLARKREVDC